MSKFKVGDEVRVIASNAKLSRNFVSENIKQGRTYTITEKGIGIYGGTNYRLNDLTSGWVDENDIEKAYSFEIDDAVKMKPTINLELLLRDVSFGYEKSEKFLTNFHEIGTVVGRTYQDKEYIEVKFPSNECSWVYPAEIFNKYVVSKLTRVEYSVDKLKEKLGLDDDVKLVISDYEEFDESEYDCNFDYYGEGDDE